MQVVQVKRVKTAGGFTYVPNSSVLQTVTLSESLRPAAGRLPPPIITQSHSGRTLRNINTISLRKLSTFQHSGYYIQSLLHFMRHTYVSITKTNSSTGDTAQADADFIRHLAIKIL